MRHIRTGIATVLVVSLAFLAYARVPVQDAARTPGEPKKNHEASSAARQEEPKPPKEKKEKPEAKSTKTEKQETSEPSKEAVKQHEKAEKEQQKQEKDQQKHQKDQQKHEAKEQQKQSKEQHRASAQHEHARPAGKSARIPDPQFKAHFGRPHAFAVKRVIRTTTIVPNQTRFVYSGYTFIFVDPWPTEWLLTDNCYIDYVEGEYFLFDVFHPGIRVAVFVVG